MFMYRDISAVQNSYSRPNFKWKTSGASQQMQESVLGKETRRKTGSQKPWGATGEGLDSHSVYVGNSGLYFFQH